MNIIKSQDIEVSKLPFNEKELNEIRKICALITEHSVKANYLTIMNLLNIFLGILYAYVIDTHSILFLIMHGIIFFIILKSYYYEKYFVFGYFEDYIKILEKFFKENNIFFQDGDYIDDWTIHGPISTAAERIMARYELNEALKKISKKEEWKNFFKIPKIIRIFAGVYFK